MTKHTQSVASCLLDIESVLINTQNPFTYTSGKTGPVYVDIRRLISFPQERDFILNAALDKISKLDFDVIAGGETAGIPFAAFLAEKTKKPMIYVRKKPKGFGRNAQIEGLLKEGQKVLLVEDLSNFGGSSLQFVEVIRKAGALINDVLVVFDYGRDDVTTEMKNQNITLHSMTNWNDVLRVCKEQNLKSDDALLMVKNYLNGKED